MEPVRVVEAAPKECDMWEFDEIVFIDDLHPESVPYGILREDWDAAMEANDGVVYQALKEFGRFDVFVLVSPEYWEHYKTQAKWQYEGEAPEYLPDIVEAWKNGNTEKIVRDTTIECGFMYDLEGNPVPRLVHETLYSNQYNLMDCIAYIQEHEDLFGPFELLKAPYWSKANQQLTVTYQPTNELQEVLEVWLDSIGRDVWESNPKSHYTEKYFEDFRK